MRVIDYDMAMEARWQAYYKNSYFINSEEHALAEVRNRILQDNPSFDQRTTSIFPVITIRRIGIPEMLEDMNLVAATQGLRFGKQECRVPFIKFKLRYQVDLYAASRQNFDEMAVEIQENLTRFQFMTIVTNDPVWGTLDITIDKESVEDNSDIDGREENVNLYRASFVYTIDAIISRKFRHLSVKKFIIEYDDDTRADDFKDDGVATLYDENGIKIMPKKYIETEQQFDDNGNIIKKTTGIYQVTDEETGITKKEELPSKYVNKKDKLSVTGKSQLE